MGNLDLTDKDKLLLNGTETQKGIKVNGIDFIILGLDAVAHRQLFNNLQIIQKNGINDKELDEFIKKYRLNFENEEYGFEGSMIPIRSELFIPNQRERNSISYFEPSYYLSHLSFTKPSPKGIIDKLIYRTWSPEDLRNPEIIKNSQRFADLIWEKSIEKMKPLWHTGNYRDLDRIQLEKKLVNYYIKNVFYRADKI